jgi:hypothetical protein
MTNTTGTTLELTEIPDTETPLPCEAEAHGKAPSSVHEGPGHYWVVYLSHGPDGCVGGNMALVCERWVDWIVGHAGGWDGAVHCRACGYSGTLAQFVSVLGTIS